MWVKFHRSSRTVVAICDENLLGKTFRDGIRRLQITESFFKGEIMLREEVAGIMKSESLNGSSFNIVGRESVNLALSVGIIEKDSWYEVEKIPFVITC
ncbi:MAG: DUF424 domain-containing protein [Nanoarchaeota archaeon]